MKGLNPYPGLRPFEESEADLDVAWSGAIAPKATIKFVVSASTTSTVSADPTTTTTSAKPLLPFVPPKPATSAPPPKKPIDDGF